LGGDEVARSRPAQAFVVSSGPLYTETDLVVHRVWGNDLAQKESVLPRLGAAEKSQKKR